MSYQNDDFFRNRIDYLINGIETKPIDVEKLENFFAYNDQLDISRGIKLQDYIPTLAQARLHTVL
jgi:hypothetical protein